MFFRKKARRRAHAERLYSQIVKRARDAELYENLGVDDSLDGRFDALILHLALLRQALGTQGAQANELISLVLETLVTDMDRTMREMGVGDLSVGKKVKAMMTAYKGREVAYAKALDEGDASLREALVRNLYRGSSPNEDVLAQISARITRDAETLERAAADILAGGDCVWSENHVPTS
jgi:cytochrome b pre-mRNA-processing protein 3